MPFETTMKETMFNMKIFNLKPKGLFFFGYWILLHAWSTTSPLKDFYVDLYPETVLLTYFTYDIDLEILLLDLTQFYREDYFDY